MRNNKRIVVVACCAAVCGFAIPVLAAPVLPFFDSFESYDQGYLEENNGLNSGWYNDRHLEGGRTQFNAVTNAMNSPWDVGGSNVVAVIQGEDGGGVNTRLNNYFSGGPAGVTGSLGAPLTGSGYTIAWDFRAPAFGKQPLFTIFSSNNTSAVNFQVRHDIKQLRYNDGATLVTNAFTFTDNRWYRFEVHDIDVGADTWNLKVYEWNATLGEGVEVIALTGVSFQNSVSDVNRFYFMANSSGTSTFYLDNFSVIPEPGTLAAAGLAAGLLVFLRRRARR